MNVIDEYLRWLLDYLDSPDGLQRELREIYRACKSAGLEEYAVEAVCYYIRLVHDKHKAILNRINDASTNYPVQ
jgi:hypothetical protein